MKGERQHSPQTAASSHGHPALTTGQLLTAAGPGLGDPGDSFKLPDPNELGLPRHLRSHWPFNEGSQRMQTSKYYSASPEFCTGNEKRAETCTAVPALQSRAPETAVSASSRQIALTCKPVPKSYAKPVSQFHPKHIKFLLQEHMLGSLEAPHTQPTRAAKPPRIPWFTYKNLLLTEVQRIADKILHSCFSQGKTRQLPGCVFYMLQSKQKC